MILAAPNESIVLQAIGGRDELASGHTDNFFVRQANHIGKTLVAVKDTAVGNERGCAFAHFLKQHARGVVGAAKSINLIALRTVHDEGIDFATADGFESLLRLTQLLSQLPYFGEDQKSVVEGKRVD